MIYMFLSNNPSLGGYKFVKFALLIVQLPASVLFAFYSKHCRLSIFFSHREFIRKSVIVELHALLGLHPFLSLDFYCRESEGYRTG